VFPRACCPTMLARASRRKAWSARRMCVSERRTLLNLPAPNRRTSPRRAVPLRREHATHRGAVVERTRRDQCAPTAPTGNGLHARAGAKSHARIHRRRAVARLAASVNGVRQVADHAAAGAWLPRSGPLATRAALIAKQFDAPDRVLVADVPSWATCTCGQPRGVADIAQASR